MASSIRWEDAGDGVVNLLLDAPDASANTMNQAFIADLGTIVDRLEAEKESFSGVVITSGKKTFFAGGDLNELVQVGPEHAEEFAAGVEHGKALLRRLEKLGKPVVAAINGAALGGGLEICLACHHRVAVAEGVVLGFPEVQLGLLPGAGGVVRSVRMLGIVDALMNLLLQGQRVKPAKALEMGLIGEVVQSADELVPAAKAWIAANPEAVQPWDVKGHKIPGGTPSNPKLAQNLPAFPSNLRKQLKGANYPAPKAIMAVAVEGAQVDIDTAFAIEGRWFTSLAVGPVAKNMIQAFFFDLQQVNGLRGRAKDAERYAPKKVVVLGAGMMGAGIAYQCAKSGIEVVLKDVTQEAADKGKSYSATLVEKGVSRGKVTQEKGDALLARITATDDASLAQDADLVIEAVFEDPKVKEQVFAEIEPFLAPGALLGSNTSTLPITGLSEYVSRPEDFIGLHFFSPVDKMPLLEIIKGEKGSEDTLNRALDVAKVIGKTPIVVNDSRGFFTSRVIGTFINEGIAMLAEGIAPSSIEQASSQAGYPAPVLQLSDELNMELMTKIRKASKEAVEADGGTWVDHPAFAVIDTMIAEGRPSRLKGAGFYEYAEGKRTGLWAGLRETFPVSGDPSQVSLKDLEERMMFIETLETVKCIDEGVIESVADANIGSIMGIGFPGWTGGVLQYANGYEGGLPGFVARSRELAEKYGERFEPPASLVALAESGGTFSDEQALQTA